MRPRGSRRASPAFPDPFRQLLDPGGERVVGVGDTRRPLDPLGRFLPGTLRERSPLDDCAYGLDELPEIAASLPQPGPLEQGCLPLPLC